VRVVAAPIQPAAATADNYGAMPSLRRLLLPIATLALLPLLALGGCDDDPLGSEADSFDSSGPAQSEFATALANAAMTPLPPPASDPDFLTPVAEARVLGLTPYWLGQSFEAGGLRWRVSALAGLSDSEEDPVLDLQYSAEPGGVLLTLATYGRDSAAVQLHWDDVAGAEGAAKEDVQVEGWRAELWEVPTGTRPVNAVAVFVHTDDATVLAVASSGDSGIPGDDANPLLDKDLLIATLAEHLRPYPD
jgi:hypothetical protein